MEQFGLREVLALTAYDLETGRPVIYFDSLKMSTISTESEQVKATGGRGNADLIIWDLGRTGKVAAQDALLSTKSLELITGNKAVVGKAVVYMRQDTEWVDDSTGNYVNKGGDFPLTADASGNITLAKVPIGGATAVMIYEADKDGGTPVVTSGATLTGNVYKLAGIANKKVVAYYKYETAATAETYVLSADKYPGAYLWVGDTVVRSRKTQKDELFQVIIPKGKLSSNFSLQMSAADEPEPIDFEITVLSEGSGSSNLIKMVKY